MTTSTPRTNCLSPRRGLPVVRSSGGFTLVEVMVATVLSTIVLGGVLGAFLTIGRTSVNSSSYSQSEAEVRRTLELFGQDARLASDVLWVSDHCLTLTVARPTNPVTRITYTYDDQPTSATYRCFIRIEQGVVSSVSKKVLAREVSEISFQRYKLEQPGVALNVAVNDLETKQLQLTLRSSRRNPTTAIASQAALSACYILRNKRVSN